MDDPVVDVFINCPFDDDFVPIFHALIFTLMACRFRPRSALELDDGAQARLEKIYGLIEEYRYGIHDLSRTELDAVHGLPRFNMPLELGLFLGAKRFGEEQHKSKRALILDVEKYRYQKFISDLAGIDISAHAGLPEHAVQITRDWLANVSRRDLPSADRVKGIYQEFQRDLPLIAHRLEYDPGKIPYFDFERIVARWLLGAPEIAGR